MDWPAFWTAFFASSGAAAIGFTSAAWVYWRTRRAERHDAEARERRERVSAVQTAVLGDLVAVAGWRFLPVGLAIPKIARAISEFAAAEMVDHPAVATWSMERLVSLGKLVAKAERWWPLPAATPRGEVLKDAVFIATALVGWERGALTDDWFVGQLSDKGRETITPPPRRRRR